MNEKIDLLRELNALVSLTRNQHEEISQQHFAALKAKIRVLRKRTHNTLAKSKRMYQLEKLKENIDQLIHAEFVTKEGVDIRMKKMMWAFEEQHQQLSKQITELHERLNDVVVMQRNHIFNQQRMMDRLVKIEHKVDSPSSIAHLYRNLDSRAFARGEVLTLLAFSMLMLHSLG